MKTQVSELHFLFHMLHFYVRVYISFNHAGYISHCTFSVRLNVRPVNHSQQNAIICESILALTQVKKKTRYTHKSDARNMQCDNNSNQSPGCYAIVSWQANITAVFHRKVDRLQVFLWRPSQVCLWQSRAFWWERRRRKESKVKKLLFWTYLRF